jgi:hypothetical protein
VPLPLLAHQAPVLPLKLARPAWWNGTALVVGSMAPDLQYLRLASRLDSKVGIGHSLVGQLAFCLPITLTVVLVIGRFRLGEVLMARLGPRVAWLALAATDVARPGGLRRAALSALVGSMSHVALDGLTHSPARYFPTKRALSFAGLHFAPLTLVQLGMSAACAVVSLWCLRRMATRGRGENPCPERRGGASLIALLAAVGATAGVADAWPAILSPDTYFDAGRLYVWGLVAFFAAIGAGGGVLIAGVILAVVDRRGRATPS